MRIIAGATIAISGFAASFAGAIPYGAQALTSAETGLVNTASNAGLRTSDFSVQQFVGTVINAALGIIGVVFLILIIYGGLMWMLSEGDETKIGKARGLIFHSIIGLILVLSAYAITNFVVGTLITQTIQP